MTKPSGRLPRRSLVRKRFQRYIFRVLSEGAVTEPTYLVNQTETSTKQSDYRPRKRRMPRVAFTRTNRVSMSSHIERRNEDSPSVPMPNSDDHCSK